MKQSECCRECRTPIDPDEKVLAFTCSCPCHTAPVAVQSECKIHDFVKDPEYKLCKECGHYEFTVCHSPTVTPPETANYLRTTGDGHCYKCHEDCNTLVHGCSVESITPCTQNCGKWFKSSTPDTVRGWVKRWCARFENKEMHRTDVIDFIETELATAIQEDRERKAKELEGMKKQDLNLEPGFNITAEYRLGEIRGGNKTIDEAIRTLLLNDKIQ